VAAVALPIPSSALPRRVLRAALITDLHHGLAPDATVRFDSFLRETKRRRNLDLAIQLGDFCHPGDDSQALTKNWQNLDLPRINVLGNHDMDRGTKGRVMEQWGMKEPYGAYDHGDFRFIVLDLNHFKKGKELVPYAGGNYFTSGVTHNWADPEQLRWLARELRTGAKPTIILSHQPLGMWNPGKPLPPEQEEVMDIIRSSRQLNPKGGVVACICGHLHVDRLEIVHGIPCLCVNSASYFWSAGMHPYRDPLFAFLEIDPAGELRIYGRQSVFTKAAPKVDIAGMAAAISDRRIRTRATSG
jgi:predicted phosphodiesterase